MVAALVRIIFTRDHPWITRALGAPLGEQVAYPGEGQLPDTHIYERRIAARLGTLRTLANNKKMTRNICV